MALQQGMTVAEGHYRLDRFIDGGAMGEVWEATQDGVRKVAIKFIREEKAQAQGFSARFKAEIAILANLQSEYCVGATFWGDEPAVGKYMVMDLLQGTNLATVLERGRIRSVETAVDYVVQACHALAEAHALGIVHRDLKPANLFRLAKNQRIKVLDFGIALATEVTRSKLTSEGSFLGTVDYSSPEQLRDSSSVDRRSDIWSLGVILYELLSGKTPFRGNTATEAFYAITSVEHEPLRSVRLDLPAGVSDIVDRCLEKEPARRFGDVISLVEALAPFGSALAEAIRDELKVSYGEQQDGVAFASTELGERSPEADEARTTRDADTRSRTLEPVVVSLQSQDDSVVVEIEDNRAITPDPVIHVSAPPRSSPRSPPRRSNQQRVPPVSGGEELHNYEKLVTSILSRPKDRDIVFLLGAGFSAKSVPLASAFVMEIEAHLSDDFRDEWLRRKNDFENQYQGAFHYLYDNRQAEFANQLVRAAILKGAHKPPVPAFPPSGVDEGAFCYSLELDPSRWNLPPGVVDLGFIIAKGLGRPKSGVAPVPAAVPFSKIHLTTNFDPLLAIAIRMHQAEPNTPAIAGPRLPVPKPDRCTIAHLHGRWDEGDTLHVDLEQQLTDLQDSLKELLLKSTVVVLGYGGWDDIFMRTLRNIGSGSRIDVLWGFFRDPVDDPHSLQLMRELRALHRRRISFFRDCRTDDVFRTLRSRIEPEVAKAEEELRRQREEEERRCHEEEALRLRREEEERRRREDEERRRKEAQRRRRMMAASAGIAGVALATAAWRAWSNREGTVEQERPGAASGERTPPPEPPTVSPPPARPTTTTPATASTSSAGAGGAASEKPDAGAGGRRKKPGQGIQSKDAGMAGSGGQANSGGAGGGSGGGGATATKPCADCQDEFEMCGKGGRDASQAPAVAAQCQANRFECCESCGGPPCPD